jgi:hypothetical protein
MSDTERFAGLTKTQALGVLASLIAVCLALQAFDTYRLAQVADQGAQAHNAACNYRADLVQRASDGAAFLKLTPRQRRAKYGPALGSIPDATIAQSLRNERAAIDSLSGLDCLVGR